MQVSTALLLSLAFSGTASPQPVITEQSVIGSVGSQDHSSSTVSVIGTKPSIIPNEDADSSTRDSRTSVPSSTHPRDPGLQLTISHSQQSPADTESSEVPSLQTCMSLCKRLLRHDPRVFDLARCPVDGKSEMRDAILRCQAENPLAPEEDRAELEKRVQEFFKAMWDDCEKGRRLLADHLPLRNALCWLGGLIAAGGGVAYACKCRKCLRKQFDKYVKCRTPKSADAHLPSYRDENSDESNSEDNP